MVQRPGQDGRSCECAEKGNSRFKMGVSMIQFEAGQAGISGPVRGGDESGHDTFVVQLPDNPPLFGEWRSKWAENQNDFEIEIVRFGYLDRFNVDNVHRNARRKLSYEEQKIVRQLVSSLFTNAEAQEGISPFSLTRARFLAMCIFFQAGRLGNSCAVKNPRSF